MHDFCLVIFTLKNLQDLLLLGSFSGLRYHFGRLVWKSTEYTFGISPLWSVCQLERRAAREGWDLPGTKQWEPTHCRNRQPGSRGPLCTLTIITINIIINTPTVSGRQQHHNALKTLAQEFSFSRSWCDLWLKAIRYQLIGFTLIYIVVSSSSVVVIITRRSVVQIVLKNKEPWHL